MDELSRAVNGSEKAMSGFSLAIDHVDLFKERKMQSFKALLHEITEEGEEYVPHRELVLTFVKFGIYVRGVYLYFEGSRCRRRMYQRTRSVYKNKRVFPAGGFGRREKKK